MSMIRKTIVSAALAVAFCGSAYAASIDPDGSGGMGAVNVSVLDWTLGNAMVVPVDTGSGSATGVQVGDILQTYAHARIASFNDADGNPVTGLFGNSEWTYVLGFKEEVISVTGSTENGTATFRTIAGDNNFFNIYYSNTAGTLSNNLTGLNFNDATLVLSAKVLPFDINDPNKAGETSFTANTPLDADGNPIFANFDQFGTDNYPAIDTISGQGGGTLALELITFNALFFPGGLPSLFQFDFDTQVNLPFDQTNPSACFWDGTQYISGAGGQETNCVNTVGNINGVTGPNLMLMTDSSTNFAVPEPMSLALMGLGLAGMGLVGRRRKA